MKKLLPVILMLTALCVCRGEAGIPSLLDSACKYLDTQCLDTLTELRKIASGTEAGSGDWKAIKPLLAKLKGRIPGAYFYALPDGNYYSVDLDYTGLNLSDRDYFPGLFAGNEVHGFPIHSRSTGKKSALFAVPVMVGGKSTGALGASLYLEDLRQHVEQAVQIPEDHTWFVVSSDGNTILDREAEYIFMNALTQGGESLAAAIKTVVGGERGKVAYEIGGIKRDASFQKLPSLDWWMLMAKRDIAEMRSADKLDLSLNHFVPRLQKSLQGIDSYLKSSLKLWETDWTDESQIRAELKRYLDEQPMVFEALFVDDRGMVRAVQPPEYKNLEQTNLSDREWVRVALSNRSPMLSSAFTTLEGHLAVSIAHPVFDPDKRFLGSVMLYVRPELLVSQLLRDNRILENYELWIMQSDGLIVYDQDREEVGKNLLTDPLYQDYTALVELAVKICAASKGQGQYVYLLGGQQSKGVKTATWDSISLRGREWRVVLTHPQK